MRALVTGASGFIGHHLVRELVAAGHEVCCLVRASSDRSSLEALGVEFVVGDITRPDTLSVVADVDAVFHLASLLKMPWNSAFHTVNAAGTGNVAAACAAAQTPPVLVVVSSLAAAGPVHAGARVEADGAQPVSIYGRVKLAAETAALAHAEVVPITIARPPMVFGEGDRSTLKAFVSVQRGLHVVPGFADRRVTMIHATDLALGLIACAERGQRAGATVGSGVYYLADPAPCTWADFGRLLADTLGTRVRVVHLPQAVTWFAAAGAELVARVRDQPSFLNLDKFREATAGDWVCDPSKAAQDLEFRCKSVKDRLAQTAAWYRAQGWLRA